MFSVRAERFSRGGAVDVRWIDGPPECEVAATLPSISQEYQGSISIEVERRFSAFYVRRVAEAFCACKGCPMPEIEVWANGAASVHTRWGEAADVCQAIMTWCQTLEASDVNDTLAFVYNHAYQKVERSWIKVKKDHSQGRYPDWAIIGMKDPFKMSDALHRYDICPVVCRLGPHRVKVVHRGGLGCWITSLWEAKLALQSLVETGDTKTYVLGWAKPGQSNGRAGEFGPAQEESTPTASDTDGGLEEVNV